MFKLYAKTTKPPKHIYIGVTNYIHKGDTK